MSRNSDAIGVGVIGLGVGGELARSVANSAGAHVSALCDVQEDLLAQYSVEFPCAAITAEALELIGLPEVQAVVVATPDDQHVRYVVRALELGKHVFCEKPVALDRNDLTGVAQALEQSGDSTVFTTNTLLRSAPRYRWLKGQLTGGRLGSILSAQTGYFYGRFHKVVGGWRGRIPDYSVVLGGGIHMIDLLSWLLGEWPVSVSATGSKRGARLHGLDFPDAVEATLVFESGLVANLSVSFASAFPHFHHLAIQGSRASFQNLPTGQAVLLDANGVIEDLSLAGRPATKGALVDEFLTACRGDGKAAVSAADTLYAAAVAISIEEALKTGESVKVVPPLGSRIVQGRGG